jgi:CRP/FNR family cyclic AMP-dependent transcriptional regulator
VQQHRREDGLYAVEVKRDDRRVPLLAMDPDLGELVPTDQLDAARAAALVLVGDLEVGPWQPQSGMLPPAGFLVLEGCLSREVSLFGEAMAVDFLGHGDVLLPSAEPVMTSLPNGQSWSVLEPTRLALLDTPFLASVQPWPQLAASLSARHERRCNWLAHVLAISHLPRVETRILALFWLFADRWGRRNASGVTVPIPLTHVNIARLIGAQRPTVTTSLNKLRADGQLTHEGHGYWKLRGELPEKLR